MYPTRTVPQARFFSIIFRTNSSSGTPEGSLSSGVRNAKQTWLRIYPFSRKKGKKFDWQIAIFG